MSQHPADGKTKPVPHSSPGRVQLDPRGPSGPNVRGAALPAVLVAPRWKAPEPVMRQTIFTASPLWIDFVVKSNAHNSALEDVPSSACSPP